jgi:hypothetical protein
MINFLKNLINTFVNKNSRLPEKIISCQNCVFEKYCINKNNHNIACAYVFDIDNFDNTKDTILLVDDNPGVIAFLKDDLKLIAKTVDISNLNILTISGKMAAFEFEAILNKHKDLRIKHVSSQIKEL